jgi:glycerol-3-phosphate dehydrogenase
VNGSLDFRDRGALFARLEERPFDLLVIGGGVTGAGVARDAAMRGLSVALVEARDFASGTSSRSSKMIHGGLRYMAQGDLALVHEAASERKAVERIAPHLTRQTPFVIPAKNAAVVAKLRTGLWAFEKLGGVPKDRRHEVWSADDLAANEPAIDRRDLTGAVVYPEYLTDDARLTLANVRSAAAHGAWLPATRPWSSSSSKRARRPASSSPTASPTPRAAPASTPG